MYNGYSDTYLPLNKPDLVKDFFSGFYKEIGVSPLDVEYIEAFAPGNIIFYYNSDYNFHYVSVLVYEISSLFFWNFFISQLTYL